MTDDDSSCRAHVDVLVVGGGNAGISAAARLIRKNIADVAVIEPQLVHTYRPLLSYVGSGQASQATAERTQRSVIPHGCRWIRDSVVAVDASAKRVRCASGDVYSYDDLILGVGLVPDDDALPGIDAALASDHVASNYLDAAEKTSRLVAALPREARAVFTVPRPPVSCTGTTIKPLFLAIAQWRRLGGPAGSNCTLVVDRPGLLGVPDLDAVLSRHLDRLGVRVVVNTAVTSVDTADQTITATGHDGSVEQISYDFLHLVPPFRGPRWITASGLAGTDPHGLVAIDPTTFRHREHPSVWAVGDGAAVDTDPSGGALRQQVAIAVDNLIAQRAGESMTRYDGYTVAPIATDAHRLILGEFDRTGRITSAIPSFLGPLRPRRIAWAFDRYVLPRVYWNFLLKGLL